MEITKTKSVAEREDEGTVVKISDENGDVQDGVTITVAGTYSSRYRRAEASQRGRLLKQRRTNISGEDLQRQQLELIAACIIDWQGFTVEGKPYLLNKENAVALLESAPWIREQVDSAMVDHSSFFSPVSVT